MKYQIAQGIQVSLDNTTWYKLTDHNRQPIAITYNLIEATDRMANGTLRKYVVAKKFVIGADWKDLPTLDSNLVDYVTPSTTTETGTRTITHKDISRIGVGPVTSISQTGQILTINTATTPHNPIGFVTLKDSVGNNAKELGGFTNITPGVSFNVITGDTFTPSVYAGGKYDYIERVYGQVGTITKATGGQKSITYFTTNTPLVNDSITVYNVLYASTASGGVFTSVPEYSGNFTVTSVIPGTSFTVTTTNTVTDTTLYNVNAQPNQQDMYYTVVPNLNIKSITSNGVSATYTTSTTPSVGSTVVVSGATTAGYNGSFTVASVVEGESFTVANTTASSPSSTATYKMESDGSLITLKSATSESTHGGAWIKAFYEGNAFNPVWVKIIFAQEGSVQNDYPDGSYLDSKSSTGQVFEAFMSTFTYNIIKRRNGYDYVDLRIEFTEV